MSQQAGALQHSALTLTRLRLSAIASDNPRQRT